MIKSICILGGGTSGLVTALILKKWHPSIEITIVESSTVGIIGVGEGSTEHWSSFLSATRISLKELITETDATMKAGIKFDNWNGDGKFFMHALHAEYTESVSHGLSAIMVSEMIAGAEHLTPDNIINSLHYIPLNTSVNQYHFDTNKLNMFLHKKCKEFGVHTIDADVVDVELDQEGYVKSLIDKDNTHYSADFFVDCSGFAKLIGSKLGAKWIDCKEYLPMDRAIAFPTEREEDIPSYTLSRALSSGWQWRIPTQNRYGNGYVYSSEFLTEGQAIDEVQKYYSEKINVAKSIKFSAGYTDKFWIKNCVSIGLSGSFVEPLEASSIGTSIQQAFGLGSSILYWNRGETLISNKYNEHFHKVATNIIDFVQLHYVTKRNDSDFWKSCKSLKLTDFNQETLGHFKKTLPSGVHFSDPFILFKHTNWTQVMYGLEMFDMDSIRKFWNNMDPRLAEECTRLIARTKQFQSSNPSFTHREALNFLMSKDFNG
jgi:tryptophan halogenase